MDGAGVTVKEAKVVHRKRKKGAQMVSSHLPPPPIKFLLYTYQHISI